MRTLILLALATPAFADSTLRFTSPPFFLPPVKHVVITKAGEPGPGQAKHSAIAAFDTVNADVSLPDQGAFDLWFVPKDGLPVKAVSNLKPANTRELKLNSCLAVINYKGDDQPRGKLIVTSYDDPGPEGKRHRPIQSASDIRADMAVPPGDYAIWIAPDSGTRARKIVDKVRAFAGKTTSAE